MEITGKVIIDLGETSGVSKAGNAWKKHEYVLETIGDQFPRKVKFHIFGQRADEFMLATGQNYTVSFDIESREFNGRWYTDISVYRAVPADGSVVPPASQPTYTPPAQQPFGGAQAPAFTSEPAPAFPEPAGADDLPF